MASVITAKNIDESGMSEAEIETKYKYYIDEISWTYSIWVIVYSFTMAIGGKIECKFGPKIVIFIGSSLIMLGLFLTYLVFETVDSPYYLYFSYGILLYVENATNAIGSGAKSKIHSIATTPYNINVDVNPITLNLLLI